jgi:hypothetical protein
MPTAIEIFKFLPKKNCGKCNFPTCLAFAMQLANQKAKLSDCPFVTDEAKAKLEASSAPPIRLVAIGSGDSKVELGDETELYRHEKKFFHPTRYCVVISDNADDNEVAARLRALPGVLVEHAVDDDRRVDSGGRNPAPGVGRTFGRPRALCAGGRWVNHAQEHRQRYERHHGGTRDSVRQRPVHC